MPQVHPTALVEEGAELAADVVVGPLCHIGPEVRLARGVRLESHVVVHGRTSIGEHTHIYPFAAIGHAPQDLKYKGEPSELIIGSHTRIREHVTMHPGTEGGAMVTRVGSHCLFMAATHVAHDCVIGDRVIMANNATLGGHVHIHDHAVLGGLVAVHQFVRIGQHAMIGGMSGVEHDVVPYGLVMGNRAFLAGLNLVGLKRRGLSREEIQTMRGAYRALFEGEGPFAERLDRVALAHADHPRVMEIIDFIRAGSGRALCHPRADRGA
jgi:UDP-N-acetylglucosamine acyltransferase